MEDIIVNMRKESDTLQLQFKASSEELNDLHLNFNQVTKTLNIAK